MTTFWRVARRAGISAPVEKSARQLLTTAADPAMTGWPGCTHDTSSPAAQTSCIFRTSALVNAS